MARCLTRRACCRPTKTRIWRPTYSDRPLRWWAIRIYPPPFSPVQMLALRRTNFKRRTRSKSWTTASTLRSLEWCRETRLSSAVTQTLFSLRTPTSSPSWTIPSRVLLNTKSLVCSHSKAKSSSESLSTSLAPLDTAATSSPGWVASWRWLRD